MLESTDEQGQGEQQPSLLGWRETKDMGSSLLAGCLQKHEWHRQRSHTKPWRPGKLEKHSTATAHLSDTYGFLSPKRFWNKHKGPRRFNTKAGGTYISASITIWVGFILGLLTVSPLGSRASQPLTSPMSPGNPTARLRQTLKCFALKGLEIEGSIQKLLQRHQVSVPVPCGWCSCWVPANIPGRRRDKLIEGLGWLHGYP